MMSEAQTITPAQTILPAEENTIYILDKGFLRLLNYMGNDVTVVNAARVSFGKRKETMDEKDAKLIRYLIQHKHTSTLEHNVFTFHIKCPLFVRGQWHRHRTWSYNEISRRYTSFNIEFYEPEKFRRQAETNRQASVDEYVTDASAIESVKQHHQKSLDLYNELLEKGVAREQARGVLPQNMYTEFYGTVNLNNLLKFIDLRIHEGAQWEITQYAKAALQLAKKSCPLTIEAYEELVMRKK